MWYIDFMEGAYMSKSINISASFLKCTESKAQGVLSYKKETNTKVAGIENAETGEDTSRDTILNISREARLKSANHADTQKSVKKSGITSAREVWENDAVELKQNARGNRGNVGPDMDEIMRIEAPKMYAEMKMLEQKSFQLGGFDSEEGREYFYKALRCMFKFDEIYYAEKNKNLLKQQYGVLDTLDAIYSDTQHDTSFNFYSEGYTDSASSLWRFKSKFNVLLSVEMIDELITQSDEKKSENKKQDILSGIHNAVTDIKEVEKKYEGDLEYLRFGVKLWNDGKVTYHANYKGCENAEGITANSADELLEMLMAQ